MNLRRYSLIVLLVACVGCGQRDYPRPDYTQRGERTREIAAGATEKAKPFLEWLGTKVGEASKWAAEESVAFLEGVFEGWTREQRSSANEKAKVDLNTATEGELLRLPDVTRPEARRIVASRPFHNTHELVTKGILSEQDYRQTRDLVEVR